MNKEEIKHFKSLLRQGSLRHMNILLDDKFQKELLTIIKDYEQLQQENEKLKDNWNKLKEYIKETKLKEFEKSYGKRYGKTFTQAEIIVCNMILNKMQELQGSNSNE